ncbi:hypothetical protein [Undibacterium fentianense]|nr:hypothetical protein [Undibacterium fentianense]
MSNLVENLIDIFFIGGIAGFFLLVLALAAMCHKLDSNAGSK